MRQLGGQSTCGAAGGARGRCRPRRGCATGKRCLRRGSVSATCCNAQRGASKDNAPRPSPAEAPFTRPAMSTTCAARGRVSAGAPGSAARAARRERSACLRAQRRATRLQKRRNLALRLVVVAQPVEALVRDVNTRLRTPKHAAALRQPTAATPGNARRSLPPRSPPPSNATHVSRAGSARSGAQRVASARQRRRSGAWSQP